MNIRHNLLEANGPFRLKTQNFRVVLARVRYVDYSIAYNERTNFIE